MSLCYNHVPGAYGLIVVNYWQNERKATCFAKKKKQTKELVLQRGFKEAQVLAVVNKGHNERNKAYFHKQNKEALVSGNEDSDDGE